MPCGAGKTIVGIDIISKVCQETLIIGSMTVGVRQWISELVEKSHIDRNMIGEYTGDLKELKPITVTTYQCLTYSILRLEIIRKDKIITEAPAGLILMIKGHIHILKYLGKRTGD